MAKDLRKYVINQEAGKLEGIARGNDTALGPLTDSEKASYVAGAYYLAMVLYKKAKMSKDAARCKRQLALIEKKLYSGF
jgi:hypothetical protein